MSPPGTTWQVERCTGTAADLHAASAALLTPGSAPVRRRVRVLDATRRAVVLGSSQPDDVVDAAAAAGAGIGVARRRSGGSAVLVGPGEVVWIDLVVPRADPLWSDDVGRAAWWVGDLWAGALGAVAAAGVTGATSVWRGPFRRSRWSPVVCFAGVGPGEVLDAAGAKLVGVSQRRSRQGALFQCAALLRWRPADLLGVLALTGDERARAAADLAGAAAGLGAAAGGLLVEAALARLP